MSLLVANNYDVEAAIHSGLSEKRAGPLGTEGPYGGSRSGLVASDPASFGGPSSEILPSDFRVLPSNDSPLRCIVCYEDLPSGSCPTLPCHHVTCVSW